MDYAIRQDLRRGAGLFGAVVSGLGRLLSREKPEVVVSYERRGTGVSEPVYFELEPEKLKPGLAQIEVTVTDLNSGSAVSSRKVFQLEDARKDKGDVEERLEGLMDRRPRRR